MPPRAISSRPSSPGRENLSDSKTSKSRKRQRLQIPESFSAPPQRSHKRAAEPARPALGVGVFMTARERAGGGRVLHQSHAGRSQLRRPRLEGFPSYVG